ncbi:MAG: hypothetical protein J5I47_05455 [Vicingus serpentipes]|nr:hypothetical protein [Vicingus serpentipes]
MKITTFIVLISFVATFSFDSAAQKLNYEISDNAGKMFDLGNYQRAKELYRSLYKEDLTDVKNKYYFGVCLVYTYEPEDGIEILEAVSKTPSPPSEIWYHLAKAYHLTNKYDKAIALYKKNNQLNGNNEDLLTEANRNIEMCENAKELIKKPIHVEFENLGKRINSVGKEYLPLITPDESFLFYTTRREGTTGRVYDLEGYFTADIYHSKYKYGKWSKAKSVGMPNSYGNEQTAGISENGEHVVYYVNNPTSKNNLQISTKNRSSYKKAVQIESDKINANSSVHVSGTVSNDQDYLIFSSDRAGGFGKQDLYICKKLPNGEWAEPENMGRTINTAYDECYPYLSNNGYDLYFASKGHNSMGGYDIFKTQFDLSKKEWSKPINIGYPINNPDDNMSICFSENKKFAYVAANRKDSEGDLDIYRVNFLNISPSYTTYKGFVLNSDSSLFNIPLTIEVFNAKTKELYGIYQANEKKGSYIMILPPNKYEINIEVPGKGTFKETLLVEDRSKYKKEINRNIRISF